jgi:hypothetical protein
MTNKTAFIDGDRDCFMLINFKLFRDGGYFVFVSSFVGELYDFFNKVFDESLGGFCIFSNFSKYVLAADIFTCVAAGAKLNILLLNIKLIHVFL